MHFTVFHQDTRRLFRGRRDSASPFGHAFGGAAEYRGLVPFAGQPPVHLLLRLDTDDPAVGVRVPGVRWLPLLCAIRYGACDLGYRVSADDAVTILHQREKRPWDGFPTSDYSDKLPMRPLALVEITYNPADPRQALYYAGVFGYDALTAEQRAALPGHVIEEGLYDADTSDWETAEAYVFEGNCWPFEQGRPDEDCPDDACPNHGRPSSLRTLAIFQEGETETRLLWGDNCGSLQIIWQVCPECRAMRVTNQAT